MTIKIKETKEIKEITINEIEGFRVGHAQNLAGGAGCTVILCEGGAAAGVDVRGAAPASRETDLLRPDNMVERIHAVMLSGGSAYGLDAASGAMAYLEERGIGFDVGVGVVPIVCAASIFDLHVGDPACRPDKAMGYAACEDAGRLRHEGGSPAEGNVGAGTGACVGKLLGPGRMMKSGLGIYAAEADGVRCGAVVAVNALGDVIDMDTGLPLAGLLNEGGTAVDSTLRHMWRAIRVSRNLFSGGNTTIGCVVTNARLTKTQANRLATVAHDGYARVIRPVHTSSDGDAIFAMCAGDVDVNADALGALASEVMARAVNRAALAAKGAYGLKSASDLRRGEA